MAKKDISLKAITEVLLNETEALQNANKLITEVLPDAIKIQKSVTQFNQQMNKRVNEIENMEVDVDPSAIERALEKAVVIPQWFEMAFAFVSILAVLGFGFGLYWQQQKKAPFDPAKVQELQLDRAYLLKYANYMSKKNPKSNKEYLEENPLPESLKK